jgi:hypothetical protein
MYNIPHYYYYYYVPLPPKYANEGKGAYSKIFKPERGKIHTVNATPESELNLFY